MINKRLLDVLMTLTSYVRYDDNDYTRWHNHETWLHITTSGGDRITYAIGQGNAQFWQGHGESQLIELLTRHEF